MILGNQEVSSSSSSDSAGGTGNWFLCSTAHEFRRALILNSLHFWPKPERESSIIKIIPLLRGQCVWTYDSQVSPWSLSLKMVTIETKQRSQSLSIEITIVELNFSSMWSLWSLGLQKKQFSDGKVYNKTTLSDRYHSYRWWSLWSLQLFRSLDFFKRW